jgi:hypothetical protein
MPGTGFYQRTKPYVQILLGDDPNNPSYLRETAPVKDGEVIMSGMVCSLEYVTANERYEWVKGWAAGRVPHIARQDYISPDVLEAGVLTGLSCNGQFRIRTGYYKTDAATAYNAGTAVVPDGTTGNLTTSTGAAGAAIMGYLSNGMRGAFDISAENNEASNGLVVDFDTKWHPQAA